MNQIRVSLLVCWLAVALLIVVIALVAGWLPERRATTVEPMEALRTE